MNLSKKTNFIVKGSLLLALSVLLSFVKFSIFPAVKWLEIDLSAVPLIIGALAFGPLSGFILTALLELILFFLGSSTGGVGELANFFMLGIFVLIIGFIYKNHQNKKSLITGSVLGTIGLIIGGMIANHFVLIPLYLKFMPNLFNGPLKYNDYILKWVPMFNFIKGFLVSLIAIMLYERLKTLLFKENSLNKTSY